MRIRTVAAMALVLVLGPARAHAFEPSPLAFAWVENPQSPRLILAQRAIEREWGPSDDSLYVEKDVPGWRSEAVAMSLSAVVPGTGQAYAGELKGLLFTVAEVLGWTVRRMLTHDADGYRNQALTYAGNPQDSTATWSFARWSKATEQDPAALEQLYAADPTAFYQVIGSQQALLAGWDGDPNQSRSYYNGLNDQADKRFSGAHATESLLWVNHLVSAFDALRVARLGNIALGPTVGLRIKSGFSHGRPEVMASVVRSF